MQRVRVKDLRKSKEDDQADVFNKSRNDQTPVFTGK